MTLGHRRAQESIEVGLRVVNRILSLVGIGELGTVID